MNQRELDRIHKRIGVAFEDGWVIVVECDDDYWRTIVWVQTSRTAYEDARELLYSCPHDDGVAYVSQPASGYYDRLDVYS